MSLFGSPSSIATSCIQSFLLDFTIGTTRDQYVGLLRPLDDLVRRDGQRRRNQPPVRMSNSLLWSTFGIGTLKQLVTHQLAYRGNGHAMPSIFTIVQVDNTCT
eukprot:1631811-Pyramimonas_sp.AAC.1